MKQKSLQAGLTDSIKLNVFFQKFDDGTFTAECVEIPGCFVEGRSEEEAKVKIKAAIEGCFEALLDDDGKRTNRARYSVAF